MIPEIDNALMKVLVCGGRDYTDHKRGFQVLDDFAESNNIDLIIHGGARGADAIAAFWALLRGIKAQSFPAQWSVFGKSAGMLRNKRMIEEGKPDIVIAFPGGAGTENMKDQAKSANIKVMEIDE